MPFEYRQCGASRLTPQEEQLLERMDNAMVPFFAGTEYSAIADIHANVDVEIWDNPSDADCIKKEVPVTKKQLSDKIKKLGDSIQVIRHKFEQAGEDREEKNKLECLMGDMGKLQYSLIKRLEQLQKNYPLTGESTQIKDTVFLIPCGLYTPSRPRPLVKLFRQMIWCDSDLAITYVHEMMHAFYDKDHTIAKPDIPLVEEPMTEFAMLSFMESYMEQNPEEMDLLSRAERNVKSKKFSDGFCYYGFGHHLYSQKFIANNNGINTYRNIISNIGDSKERQAYEKCFTYEYPELTEMYAANMLAKVFNAASKLTPTPLVVGGTRKTTVAPTTKTNVGKANPAVTSRQNCNCTTDDIDEAIKQHIVPLLKQLGKDMSITIDYNSKKGTTEVSKKTTL